MMLAIVVLHRWLGIVCCLLFAMWFASGIVMHFVPFPQLTNTERFAGLAPIDGQRVVISPSSAIKASGLNRIKSIRLLERSDGPIYVIVGEARDSAIRAADGSDAQVESSELALAIAKQHASRNGVDASHATVEALADYDQWTVPNGFDRHRPLFRVALHDASGMDVYVSSATGEVVLCTARGERWWNILGSVPHWIYPTILRSNWLLWDKVVWSISLVALIATVLGVMLGVARIKVTNGRLQSPFRGWYALHHVMGLLSTVFLLAWVASGWLSMDHGRLFSRGVLTQAEADILAPDATWSKLSSITWPLLTVDAREVGWFIFGERVYRRDQFGLDQQILVGAAEADGGSNALSSARIREVTGRLAAGCGTPSLTSATDDYPAHSALPSGQVYRVKCRGLWFDIDSASGSVLQRLDASRRAYRWLYGGLHTLDFPFLLAHPRLRGVLIVGLCALGLLFSVTGIVIGWRRLKHLTA